MADRHRKKRRKQGRFCKIKKVVSSSSPSCSSIGLKRHKVLVVLDRVEREEEDETDFSLSDVRSVPDWLLLNFLPALSRSPVSISCLSLSHPSVSGVSGVYTVR